MDPTICVVTPTLNAERYLADCLASVRQQDYPHVAQLVMDGGSSDGTLHIAEQYGVACLVRPGQNQSAAVNEGFRVVRGEILAWLNADDTYTPGALRCVGETFARDPALDAVYGDCEVIGADDRPLWLQRPGPYDFRRLLRTGNYLAQPAVFVHRRVIERTGPLDESLEHGFDYDLWLRLRGARVEYVPRTLAVFRWHEGGKTALNRFRVWREFIRVVRRHGGGITPEIAWAFARFLFTLSRKRAARAVLGR